MVFLLSTAEMGRNAYKGIGTEYRTSDFTKGFANARSNHSTRNGAFRKIITNFESPLRGEDGAGPNKVDAGTRSGYFK